MILIPPNSLSIDQHLIGSNIECATDSARQGGSKQILLTGGKLYSLINIKHAVTIFRIAPYHY